MSTPRRSVPVNRTGLIPVWFPPLAMIVVVLLGLVLARQNGAITGLYAVVFTVVAVVTTAIVDIRGLFVTVAAQPLWWFVGSFVIGISSLGQSATTAGRKTAVLTAAYPIVEKYPWLLGAVALSIIVALLRWLLDRKALEKERRRLATSRRRSASVDARNIATVRRARGLDSPDPTGDLRRAAEERRRADATRRREEEERRARHRRDEAPTGTASPVRRRGRHYLDED